MIFTLPPLQMICSGFLWLVTRLLCFLYPSCQLLLCAPLVRLFAVRALRLMQIAVALMAKAHQIACAIRQPLGFLLRASAIHRHNMVNLRGARLIIHALLCAQFAEWMLSELLCPYCAPSCRVYQPVIGRAMPIHSYLRLAHRQIDLVVCFPSYPNSS